MLDPEDAGLVGLIQLMGSATWHEILPNKSHKEVEPARSNLPKEGPDDRSSSTTGRFFEVKA